MIRKPDAKAQANILVTDLAAMGFELQRGKALDLVAKLNGYRSWNQYAVAEKGAMASDDSTLTDGLTPALQPLEMVSGYEVQLPRSLFGADGTVSDHRLAVHQSHRKDDSTVLLTEVDFTGQKVLAEVSFKELAIGEKFFDPDCGEDFRKTGDSTAEMVSGGDAGEQGEFSGEEIVERARYTLQLSGFSRFRVFHDGEATLINSSMGLTAEMDAILKGLHPSCVETLNNPWFEWLDEDDQIVGEPFTELPADPEKVVKQYLMPYLMLNP